MSSLDSFMDKFGAGTSSEESSAEPLSADAPDALAKFLDKWNGGMDEKSYFFYNNTIELRFDKDSWTYYKVGPLGELEPQDGVTKACHIIDKSLALVPWAAKMVAQKIIRTIPVHVDEHGAEWLDPITSTDFFTLVMQAKTAPRDVLEEAGDIGHVAHKCLEDSIKYALENDPEKKVRQLIKVPGEPRAASCAYAAKKWMDAHNVRWIETERKVYSKEHKCAGTTDGLCLVDSCTDPACCSTAFKDHLSIADWKSSNYLYLEYALQTAAYQGFYVEEFPAQKVIDRWVLRLGKEDGEFEPWYLTPEDFADDFSGFLECLALYRKVELVEERMKAQKKVKRDIKKTQKAEEKTKREAEERDRKAKEKAEKKATREIEKARVKAEAKTTRDAEKAAAKAAKLMPKLISIDEHRDFVEALMNTSESQAVSSAIERMSYKHEGEGLTPSLPTKSDRGDPDVKAVLAGLREDAPVERKPFVIPKEG